MKSFEALIGTLRALSDVPHYVGRIREELRAGFRDVLNELQRDKPVICSVLMLAETSEGKPFAQCSSFSMRIGEERRHRVDVMMPIRSGASFVGINGALVRDLRVGVNAQDIGMCSGGPVARTVEDVVPGVAITYTVLLTPGH